MRIDSCNKRFYWGPGGGLGDVGTLRQLEHSNDWPLSAEAASEGVFAQPQPGGY